MNLLIFARIIKNKQEEAPLPKVHFVREQKTIECKEGQNLRGLALLSGIRIYPGMTQMLNCRGFGLCGTCKVELEPQDGVQPKPWKLREKMRGFCKGNERLSCQVKVMSDINVKTLVDEEELPPHLRPSRNQPVPYVER